MMHAWHYIIMRTEVEGGISFLQPVRGTLCGPDIETKDRAREHLAFQYGKEAGETARIRRAGEQE